MIPKRLRLKNFLSYGEQEQELNFDLFQLAVLTGENGAGKSSLIEAIPFCIWGEGRESRSDLLCKGALEARVELEFELQKNLYRITRILKLGKSAVSQELEFAIYDDALNDFRTLTHERIKDTEAEIQKRVGITYDTFINSAFFAQGKADSFIREKPINRRRILSEILGTNHYDALSKKAKDLANDIQKKIDSNTSRIELLKLDVASLPQLRAEYQTHCAQEHHAREKLAAIHALLEKIDSNLQAFQQKEKDLAVLTTELTSLTKQIEQENKQIHSKENELSDIKFHLQKRDELLRKQHEFNAIKAEVESLEHLQSRAQHLKDEITSLERNYLTQKTQLESEKKSAEERLADLNQTIDQRNKRLERKSQLLQAHRETQAKIDALKKDCARLPEIESLCDATRAKLSESRAALDSAQAQMKTISEKGKQVKEISDKCPLCQSPIDESHKEHILQAYRDEYKSYADQKKRHEALLQKLQQELLQHQEAIKSLKEKERQLQQHQNELNKITTEMASLEEVERELKKLESDVVTQNAKKEEASRRLQLLADTQSQIESLHAELSALGYNPTRHEQKKRMLKEFESVLQELATLDSKEARLKVLVKEISEHSNNIKALAQTRALKEESCNALRQALKDRADVEQHKQNALKEKQDCQDHLIFLSSQRQALEQVIAQKEEKEKLLLKLEEEIAPDKERLELYEILAEAYGVRGVQALLLDKAIPEIERLANELLAQLTNNLFSLSFQTEREKNDGNTSQTLEIIISDANGNTRPYETFSGGERFRIDFSLRLALSKYLSTISGTPIKLLIIDEGFGTQDPNGIEMIVEAINQVSNDFEKLILITHLEEMKDAFPTRIVVQKDPLKGSRFEVIS